MQEVKQMPKVRALGVPAKQRELEEIIKEQYGNMLVAADIGHFLNIKNPRVLNEFVSGIPGHIVVRRTKYFAADVAKKLYEDSVEARV